MKLLTTLFSFSGGISRRAYITVALVGVLIKHAMDLSIAASFHRDWTPLNYLVPVGVPVPLSRLAPGDISFLAVMLAASLPFAWVGLAITAKRFRTIGWQPWLVALFFVPIANIASFTVAAGWPERAETSEYRAPAWASKIVPIDGLGAAIFALFLTAVVGTLFIAFGTQFLNSYGWGLFAALPFIQGAIAAYLYSLRGERTLRASIWVSLLSVAVTALALLAFALEGAVCILMATPIAFGFATIGAIFGHTVGRRSSRVNIAMLLTCFFLSPTIMGAEAASGRIAPTYAVTTSVEIDAPPEVVWRNVVSFPDLPPPTELPFRIGIAYPMRARIVGNGIGAVRYCEFSTGDFVEPITAWQPQHKLAFFVRKSAEPMREWSPYGHIDTPHLHNYMVSRHGEFVLTALPGGRTRLTGTTWYQHHLWPAAYWAFWSDAIVHDIHLRVLKHIKSLSEASPAPPAKRYNCPLSGATFPSRCKKGMTPMRSFSLLPMGIRAHNLPMSLDSLFHELSRSKTVVGKASQQGDIDLLPRNRALQAYPYTSARVSADDHLPLVAGGADAADRASRTGVGFRARPA